MQVNLKENKNILRSLIEALKICLELLLENDMFKAISIILDSESYRFLDVYRIYDKVKIIIKHFKPLLLANNCSINHLKEQLEKFFYIFCQAMTRVKNSMEMLLTCFWMNIQTVPLERENAISRVTSSCHIEHPTKNPTTMQHQFCLAFFQMRRKKNVFFFTLD